MRRVPCADDGSCVCHARKETAEILRLSNRPAEANTLINRGNSGEYANPRKIRQKRAIGGNSRRGQAASTCRTGSPTFSIWQGPLSHATLLDDRQLAIEFDICRLQYGHQALRPINGCKKQAGRGSPRQEQEADGERGGLQSRNPLSRRCVAHHLRGLGGPYRQIAHPSRRRIVHPGQPHAWHRPRREGSIHRRECASTRQRS